ncbi:uncharacterized protein LOC141536125 isoform X5 [Cotesia typhae]|uniref:uncharacterized protein LOC141536125 isoform X5 n=1 Tax=Cotesia typhae TaxID=2053667 RepID=UPI003D68BDB8
MEDDQQFCLRWNNHQTTLIQNFDTLLESGTLVDCTLAAEGKYLKAHKVVLSACSPYFEGLLSEHYDKHPVFILKDVKFKELKAMMDYMYRGEVNISQDQLAALLKAAESLQIKGLSESKTGSSGSTSSSKAETRSQKTVQPSAPSLDIPHSSSGLTIEKNNKVPRQSLAQASVGDLPEDSASPSLSKGISSREGSVSPNGRKRKRYRRRSLNDDNPIDNHETSNSSDMSHQPMNVPALGVAPVADEKSMSDPSDSLGRSALMQQLTKPADDMLPMPVEKPEPNDTLIEPKSEYLDEAEDSVEDLTLDDEGMDDTMDDGNRAGPSHDPSHPGLGSWHVTGDRSNAGGVVGSVVAGAPGSNDEVFMQAQEAAQAHRDSQGLKTPVVRLIRLGLIGPLETESEKNDNPRYWKYECPNVNCSEVFRTKASLTRHMRNTCGKAVNFECPYCDYLSPVRRLFIRHLKRHDRQQRPGPLSRDRTSGLTKRPGRPPKHRLVPEPVFEQAEPVEPQSSSSGSSKGPEVPGTEEELQKDPRKKLRYYACPNTDCSGKFSSKNDLTQHYRFKCGKPPRFRCPYCEFRAKTGFDVRRHVRNVHPDHDVWIIKGTQTVVA